ncbi:alpha/beta fold hydrolase [Chitinophaga niastensis]|nr:alpha/beta fold hydrolase [Chitinophaga niastensis]
METSVSNNLSKENMQFFITGDGCRIAYQIDGDNDKPVLVLSNSIATNFHMWDAQITTLGKHFRIIRFDTRGSGASDHPLGDYSIDRMGLDVIELLDYLNIAKVHFCGLSMGGFIGQWLGIHTPERIDKLILVNTSSHLGPLSQFNNNIKSLRENPDMNGFADMFIKNWFPKKMIEEKDSIVSVFRDMVLNTNPQGLAGSFAAVRDADMRKTISLIPNNTLIIAGKHDLVTKPEDSQRMAATIPDSKLIILPSVHMSNVEYQNDFEKSLLAFLLVR